MTRKEHLIEENFVKIIALLDIRLLTKLKGNDVFALEALGIVESLIKFGFGPRARECQKRNVDVKERTLEK